VVVFLFDPPLRQYTLSATLVLYAHQYWRLVTSAFIHGGVLHIAMNMMSLVAIGSSLEQSIGTIQLCLTILWQALLCGSTSVAVSWVLSFIVFDDLSYANQNSLGFSGVLFALAVLDIHRSDVPTRSVMGMFTVPAKWHPWILLVVLQLLIPNVSFIGHLSGIVMGTFQARGGLQWVLPSVGFTRALEGLGCLQGMVRHRRFVRCRDDSCDHRENLSELCAEVISFSQRLLQATAREGLRAGTALWSWARAVGSRRGHDDGSVASSSRGWGGGSVGVAGHGLSSGRQTPGPGAYQATVGATAIV